MAREPSRRLLMTLRPEIAAAAIAVAVLVIGVLLRRWRATRTRNVGRPVSGGPANLRFVCAGCSQQFTHSRRTLTAWEAGTRRFLCNACHTLRRGLRPASRGPRPSSAKARE
jgi:hypothetical protein